MIYRCFSGVILFVSSTNNIQNDRSKVELNRDHFRLKLTLSDCIEVLIKTQLGSKCLPFFYVHPDGNMKSFFIRILLLVILKKKNENIYLSVKN